MRLNGKKRLLLFLSIPILLIGLYIGWAYNKLVEREETVERTWGDVQNTYQRRADLIPTVVSVVEGLRDYESETLISVVNARAKTARTQLSSLEAGAAGVKDQAILQDSLATSVNRVLAVVERYPDFKGTTAYLNLQTQLVGTERRIKVARQDYNNAVAEYNKAVRRSSTGFVAKMFGFKVRQPFQADVDADRPVEIQF